MIVDAEGDAGEVLADTPAWVAQAPRGAAVTESRPGRA